MTQQRLITVLPSAARTATSTAELGGSVNEFDSVDLFIDVTAVTGTSPSMTITYQASPDGGTTYYDGVASTAITAAGRQIVTVSSKLGALARISYAISGTTPSFTFSVIAQYRRTGA